MLFDLFQVLVTFSEGADDAGVYEVLAEDLFEADLKDTAQVSEGFSGGFPEGAGLEKDLGALVSYSIEDAFGFPVVDITPQGPLRDLGAFLDIPEVCTAFGLQGYERQGLDGLHVLPEVNVLHLGKFGLVVPLWKIITVFKDLLCIEIRIRDVFYGTYEIDELDKEVIQVLLEVQVLVDGRVLV